MADGISYGDGLVAGSEEARRNTYWKLREPKQGIGQAVNANETGGAPQSDIVGGSQPDPYSAATAARNAAAANATRNSAANGYRDWKNNVDAAAQAGSEQAEAGKKAVYQAGYNLWQTADGISKNGYEGDGNNERYELSQATAQFGAAVAKNHGWTLVSGSSDGRETGFDGKGRFNFFFKDANGQEQYRSMTLDQLRKTLVGNGMLEDEGKPMSISERYQKDFAGGWNQGVADAMIRDKSLPADYREFLRDQSTNMRVNDLVEKRMAKIERKFTEDTARAQAQFAADIASYNNEAKMRAEAAKQQQGQQQQQQGQQQQQQGQQQQQQGQQQQGPSMRDLLMGGAVDSSLPPLEKPKLASVEREDFDEDEYRKEQAKRIRGEYGDIEGLKNGLEGFSAPIDKTVGAEEDQEYKELIRRRDNRTLSAEGADRLAALSAEGGREALDAKDSEARAERERIAKEMTKGNFADIRKAERSAKAVSDFDELLKRYNDEDIASFDAQNWDNIDPRARERELLAVVREMTPSQRQEILAERDASGHFTERARSLRSALLYARDMGSIRRVINGGDLRESSRDRDAEVNALAAVDTDEALARRAARKAAASADEYPSAQSEPVAEPAQTAVEASVEQESSPDEQASEPTPVEEPVAEQVPATSEEQAQKPVAETEGVQLNDFSPEEVTRDEPSRRGVLPGFDFATDERTNSAYAKANRILSEKSDAEQKEISAKSDSIADRFDIPPTSGPEARFGLGGGDRAMKDKERGGKPTTDQIVSVLKDELAHGNDSSRLSKKVDDMFKEYNTAVERAGTGGFVDTHLAVRIAAQRHNMNPSDAIKLLRAVESDPTLRERFLRNYQRKNNPVNTPSDIAGVERAVMPSIRQFGGNTDEDLNTDRNQKAIRRMNNAAKIASRLLKGAKKQKDGTYSVVQAVTFGEPTTGNYDANTMIQMFPNAKKSKNSLGIETYTLTQEDYDYAQKLLPFLKDYSVGS